MTLATSQLADFVSALDARSLPDSVRATTAQHILDVIAGVFASTGIPEAVSVREALDDGAAATAGKFAMMAHAAESDPIHTGTTICAGLISVPPALLFSPDGATAVAAVNAGYETAIRIGAALGSARLLGQGWWPTAVLGGAGAAAATARARHLSAEKTRHAISLALIQTGGLGSGAPEAPESRNLLAANCVRIGVEAADAAAKGVAGPPEPLTGNRGFLYAFGFEPQPDLLLAGLGDRWAIEETSLKAFPCALQAQAALTALRELIAEQKLAADDITTIEFSLPDGMRRIVDRPDPPTSRFGAAASLQFLAAACVADGDILPDRLGEAGRKHEAVVSFMKNVTVAHDAELDAFFPGIWPARLRLVTSTGEHVSEVRVPPGHPDQRLPMPLTIERFRAYSAVILDSHKQDALIDCVENVSELKDLSPLTEPLLGVI